MRRTARRQIPVGLMTLVASLWLTGAGPSIAELVLLEGGGVLKVEGFERSGDRVDLALPGGGSLTLSVLRIERILEDEIEADPADDLAELELEIGFSGQRLVPATPFADLIMHAARRHAINPQLIAAMVRVESAFDPAAISRKGAAGLMQLMPSTAQRFGVGRQDILQPERNLDAGVRYVRWLNERFQGDLSLILAGYNAGEGSVERYRGVPPYRETREYIRRVYSAAVSASSDRARE
jgi:hypothetical protein